MTKRYLNYTCLWCIILWIGYATKSTVNILYMMSTSILRTASIQLLL